MPHPTAAEPVVSTPLDGHTKCAQCEYDLFGMDPTAVCPECGFAVATTIKFRREAELLHHSLERCDPRWLRGLVQGMTLLIITGLWTIASGFFLEAQPLQFGIAFIPGWVLSAWAVWKLFAREPAGRTGRERAMPVVRVGVVVLLCTPVLLIQPGFLRWGGEVILEWWSPVARYAKPLGLLSPIVLFFLLRRLMTFARHTGARRVQFQLMILLCIWPLLTLYLAAGAEALNGASSWSHRPARVFLAAVPKPGTGSIWLLCPDFWEYWIRIWPYGFRFGFGRLGYILGLLADAVLGAWFLVLCCCLWFRLAKAASYHEDQRTRRLASKCVVVPSME